MKQHIAKSQKRKARKRILNVAPLQMVNICKYILSKKKKTIVNI
jgi:hypothetical protein